MTRAHGWIAGLALGSALAAAAAGMAGAQELPAPDPLFAAAEQPDQDLVKRLMEPQVVRLGFGTADPRLIAGPEDPAGADAVLLNLFDDVRILALRSRFERRGRASWSWFGQPANDREGSVILVANNGRLTGFVQGRAGVFDIVSLDGDERSAIREIDQSGYGPEEPPEQPPGPAGDGGAVNGAVAGPALAPLLICGDLDFIDVLVVYTADADAAPGDILGEIQAGIDDANQSYENSGIVQRLRLVGAEEVDYVESGDTVLDRDRLRAPGDGFMDGVHARRDALGADLVSLWAESGNWCGYAYIMNPVGVAFEDRGFNAVKRSCAVGNHTFAHELGHNMSARHDRYVDSTDGSPYDYNHGLVNVAERWRTIMSYNDECDDAGTSCERLQYWSNPDLTYGGDPLGIAEGDADAADNRKTLNNTRTTVQQFRAVEAPLAHAGDDQNAECGVPTNLDGSGSCDPNGDPLTYAWSGGFLEGGGTATGVSPLVTFPQGVHEVSLVVSDGEIDSLPDTVIVDAADLTAPDIVCPVDVTVSCTDPTTPPATGIASATDVCDANPLVGWADVEIPGACAQEKTIQRTWSATDDAGNQDTCLQTVTVDDSSAPEISCGVALASLWPPNHRWRNVGFHYEASDDCDADPSVEIQVTSDEHPALEPGAGGTRHCPDARIDPAGRVWLRAERSGSGDGRVYVVQVTVTDACGSASSCMATVGVPHSKKSSVVDSGQTYDATDCGAPFAAATPAHGNAPAHAQKAASSKAKGKK